MDAQDTRTAQERIDQAEGRLAALQEQGIDTAGLNSQLAFARAALAQGQTLDVMAMCEEVLIAAKRLLAEPPVTAGRPVKTDRTPKPLERVQSGLYPSLGGPDEARDRQRLTEEIRQAVHSDLMPKALSATQLNERIRTTVERTLDERLKSLHESLSNKLDERFQRLAAEPGTTVIAKTSSAEEISAQISTQIEARIAATLDQRLESTLPSAVESAVQLSVQTAVHHAVIEAVNAAMSTVTAAVTAPVRELVAEALAQAHAHSAPPDLDALATRLGNDLRSDLDWQVERLAAEKGWVTLADVHSEIRTNGNNKTMGDAGHAPGFARLEAALVEFVRQTQSQQQQFLNVLQERVEQGTAVVAQNLAKAMAADKNRSSTVFRQPSKSDEAVTERDTAAINRATDVRPSDEQGALESHLSSAEERELDVLSMTAQHRAIDTLGDPLRQMPVMSSAAKMLPGTRVTGRVSVRITEPVAGKKTSPPEAALGDEHSSANRPSTMLIANRTALDLTPHTQSPPSDEPVVDPSAETLNNGDLPENLGTEAIEMTPLDHAGESSGLVANAIGSDSGSRDSGSPSSERFPATPDADKPTRIIAVSTSTEIQHEPQTEARPSATGAIPRPTTRVAAFETGLRNLVKGEVERQLGTAAIEKTNSPLPISTVRIPNASTARMTNEDLEQRIRAAVRKAVDDLPALMGNRADTGAGTGTKVRLSVPCDADLRAAITRSMPDLLQDHAIRQQILGVVAVEAVANPGALGELTGIRAFIRAEVRHAHGEAMPQAHDNDAAHTEPQAASSTALETSNAVIS